MISVKLNQMAQNVLGKMVQEGLDLARKYFNNPLQKKSVAMCWMAHLQI